MRNISAGLNCYLNRDDRIMFNLVYSDVDDTADAGQLYVFETRIQVEY
jgi:hypothetical protein